MCVCLCVWGGGGGLRVPSVYKSVTVGAVVTQIAVLM